MNNVQHFAFCVLVYEHERGYEDELNGCLLFISKTQAEMFIDRYEKTLALPLPTIYTKYEKIQYIPVTDELFDTVSLEKGPVFIFDIEDANKLNTKYELFYTVNSSNKILHHH